MVWVTSAASLCAKVQSFRELSAKPGLGDRPLANNGRARDSRHFRYLVDGEPAEVAQFDNARLLRIHDGKPRQGFVERHDIHVAGAGRHLILDERDVLPTDATLPGSARPRVI